MGVAALAGEDGIDHRGEDLGFVGDVGTGVIERAGVDMLPYPTQENWVLVLDSAGLSNFGKTQSRGHLERLFSTVIHFFLCKLEEYLPAAARMREKPRYTSQEVGARFRTLMSIKNWRYTAVLVTYRVVHNQEISTSSR